MIHLDCRGKQCPQPVIQTRQAMLDNPSQPIQVLIDDKAVQENITRLAATHGYAVASNEVEGAIKLELTSTGDNKQTTKPGQTEGPTIVFISSNQMGSGDAELGEILLKNFVFTLAEGDNLPDAIYFVNSGVRLVVYNSNLIEPLQKLFSQGVDIASCGLCLDYFDLKDSLAVGRISNMLELVDAMQTAGRIIRL